MKPLPSVLAIVTMAAAIPAGAVDDATVRHCRTLPDGAGRLACYDAMPVAEQRFGLAPARAKEAEPDAVHSRVAGHFDGWKTGTVLTLANGQVWRVVDDYDAFMPDLDNPPALIVRGALGAYFFQIEGDQRSARVVRLR